MDMHYLYSNGVGPLSLFSYYYGNVEEIYHSSWQNNSLISGCLEKSFSLLFFWNSFASLQFSWTEFNFWIGFRFGPILLIRLFSSVWYDSIVTRLSIHSALKIGNFFQLNGKRGYSSVCASYRRCNRTFRLGSHLDSFGSEIEDLRSLRKLKITFRNLEISGNLQIQGIAQK